MEAVHPILDRAGAHDRDLYDQIVEGRGLHAWQHGHLGATLDLEDADRVGALNHLVSLGILSRYRGQIQAQAIMLAHELEAALQAAEHAQAQIIDFHETQRVDIVLT